jgi:ABC-2 type transport system permease protein
MTALRSTTALALRRNATKAKRSPAIAFAFPVLFPLFIIGLFSQVYRNVAQVPGFPVGHYVDWMAPAVFLMAAMFGAQYSAQGLLTDMQTGYLDRLRLLPIAPSGIILGALVFDVLRVTIAGAFVLVASVALGAHWHGGIAAIVGLPLLLALWTLAYGGLFYFVGLKAKKQEAMMGLIPLFLPLSMLSTAYLPRELLPSWVQWAARFNPYSYVVDGARMFSTGHATWGTFAAAAAAAAVTAALLHRASTRAFAGLVGQD